MLAIDVGVIICNVRVLSLGESNDSRIEARECLRKANRGDDSQNQMGVARSGQNLALAGKDPRDRREQYREVSGQELTHLEG